MQAVKKKKFDYFILPLINCFNNSDMNNKPCTYSESGPEIKIAFDPTPCYGSQPLLCTIYSVVSSYYIQSHSTYNSGIDHKYKKSITTIIIEDKNVCMIVVMSRVILQ